MSKNPKRKNRYYDLYKKEYPHEDDDISPYIHNQKNSKFNVGDNVQTNEEHYTMVNHKITRGLVVDRIYSRRSCDPNEFYWVYKIKLMNDTYEYFDEGWLERCY